MKMLGMFVVSGPRRGQINENENETGVVDSLRRRAIARNVSLINALRVRRSISLREDVYNKQ